jgi:MraZ protein
LKRRFIGESVHKVDQKGRVSVPAPFRRVIEEGDPDWQPGASPSFVLIYGMPGRPHLEGYTIQGMSKLNDMVERLPMFSKTKKALSKILVSRAVYVQIDENGRIVLSASLREKAHLDGEAVFNGMSDSFQVWSPEIYKEEDADLVAALEDAGGPDALELLFRQAENELAALGRADGTAA